MEGNQENQNNENIPQNTDNENIDRNTTGISQETSSQLMERLLDLRNENILCAVIKSIFKDD